VGFVSKFERTLQGAVGDAFARLFGGKVVAAEVEAQLRKQAEASLKVADGHLLVSNSYTITLARSDYASFTEDEALAVKTFSRHLSDHISDQGWETYGPVAVTFVERDDLHTGQMRIDGVVDPDAVPIRGRATRLRRRRTASRRARVRRTTTCRHQPPTIPSPPGPVRAPAGAARRTPPPGSPRAVPH